jgi:hypothetical protein
MIAHILKTNDRGSCQPTWNLDDLSKISPIECEASLFSEKSEARSQSYGHIPC